MHRPLLPCFLVAIVLGCGAGRPDGYDPNGGGVYDDRYGPYRVDPYAVERQQARERERLNASQQAERERLLREQGRERRELKNAREWDREDRRDQSQERQRQQQRFERQRRTLGEHQIDERERYGW